jgi:hypothetical protein
MVDPGGRVLAPVDSVLDLPAEAQEGDRIWVNPPLPRSMAEALRTYVEPGGRQMYVRAGGQWLPMAATLGD